MVASFGSNASTCATGTCLNHEQIRSGRETIGWVLFHRSWFLDVDVGYSRAPLSCGSQKAQLAHYQREAFAMVQRLLEVKQSDAQQQVSLCAGKAAVSASVLFKAKACHEHCSQSLVQDQIDCRSRVDEHGVKDAQQKEAPWLRVAAPNR